MTSTNNARLPCCVSGDPWTIDSPDYVTVTLKEPDDRMTQWLGAHATCLRRAFAVQVEVGKVTAAQSQIASDALGCDPMEQVPQGLTVTYQPEGSVDLGKLEVTASVPPFAGLPSTAVSMPPR